MIRLSVEAMIVGSALFVRERMDGKFEVTDNGETRIVEPKIGVGRWIWGDKAAKAESHRKAQEDQKHLALVRALTKGM